MFGVAEETVEPACKALNGVRAVAVEDRDQVQVLTRADATRTSS